MKLLQFLVLALMLFTGADVMAQGGYNPYYGAPTYGGVDRSIDRQRSAPKTKNKKKLEEQKKEREKAMDISKVMTEYLTKKIKLDAFQEAAVKAIYDENKEEIMALSTDDAPTDVIKDKSKIISEKIDAKIIPLLSKDQAAEYQKMIDERKY